MVNTKDFKYKLYRIFNLQIFAFVEGMLYLRIYLSHKKIFLLILGISSHPILIAQGSFDSGNPRAQRVLRHRRYQYLQLSNSRNPNPPVILQRYVL